MIGVVATSYPGHAGDLAGIFVADRVRVLARTGECIDVVAGGACPGEDPPEPETHGLITVSRVPVPATLASGIPEALEAGGLGAALLAAGLATRLVQAVSGRAAAWRAIESHWLVPCGLIGALISNGRPHRAHAHGGDVALLERTPLGASAARFIAASGAEMVFASADLRARFARLAGPGAAPAGVVEPAAVDAACFVRTNTAARVAARRDLGVTGDLVFAAGRLVPVKGHDVLVRAIGRMPRARRPRVVIAGAGPQAARLRAMADARGISLTLLGAAARPQVAAWMAAADACVHPSRPTGAGRVEGMPLAVREALSCGLPVVASATGGVIELAGRPGLRLVPPDDPGALAHALAGLLAAHGAPPSCRPRAGVQDLSAIGGESP